MDETFVPGRTLPIASVPNLRDVGGYPTAGGGRVRTGLLYRSSALGSVGGEDAAALERLGIRTVYDLRGAAERAGRPDRLPEGTAYVVADVLADLGGGGPSKLPDFLADPEVARTALGDGRAEALWTGQFRTFVSLPSAQAAFGRIFRDVARVEHRPALFHCSTGKDRTGWAAAIFLLLMGVPYPAVLGDYLASAANIAPLVGPIVREFEARGGDASLLDPIFGTSPASLEVGLNEVERRYGSLEGYFADALGIDSSLQAALRAAFVEPAPGEP